MSHALINQLTETRQRVWNETKALLDTAAEAKRDLTAEEEQTYQRLSNELTETRARIDSILEIEAENRAAEEALAEIGANRSGGEPDENDLGVQLRSFLRGERSGVEISAEAMKAPWKRALQKGTASEGGNTVATSFHDHLVEHLVESSGLLQLGPTVLNTTSGEMIEVPVTTSHGAAAAVAEEASITGTDPAFAKRTLGAFKFGQLVTVSKELVDDTAVDLEGYIARIAGRNCGLALGGKLITGAGTTEPTGVLTTATAGKTGAAGAAGVFEADDLIDLFFSVIAPYRNSPSAGWLVKDATLGAIRKLKDDADRYLFEPAATFGAPDTLLGKQIKTDPTMPAVAATAKSVAFGDWSAYFVRLAGGVRFERSDHFAFGSDQITFRAIVRGDGLLADQTGAIKTFTGGATNA